MEDENVETNDSVILEAAEKIPQTEAASDTKPNMETKIKNFVTENFTIFFESLKTIILLAVPVIISYVAAMMMGFVDQIFLGHLGTKELAASALANSINLCLTYIVFGLSSGLDTLGSQAFGNQNYQYLGALVQRGFVAMTIFYIPIAILLFFIPNILSLIYTDEKFIYLTGVYIRILIPGNLFYGYHHALEEFMNSQNIMYPNMIALLASNVFNIVANTVLIYGTFIPGWNGLGYIGAPIATSLGKLFGFLVFGMIILVFGLHKKTWFGIQWKEAISLSEMWKFLKIAIPGTIQICFELWGFSFMTIPAIFLGEKYLDGHSLIFTISGISFMIPLGLGVAASVRVGNSIGEGNIKAAKISAFICISLGVLVMTGNAAIILIFRNWIPRIFTNDEEVITITANAFFVVVGSQLFDGFQGVCSGVLRGLGKQKIGAVFMFFSFYVFGIPMALLFAFVFKLKLIGLWGGLSIALFGISGFYLTYILFFINWEYEVKMAKERVAFEDEVEETTVDEYSNMNEELQEEVEEKPVPSTLESIE